MADLGFYQYNTETTPPPPNPTHPHFTITLFSVCLLSATMKTQIERIYQPCPHIPMQSFCVRIMEIWLINMSINSKAINQCAYVTRLSAAQAPMFVWNVSCSVTKEAWTREMEVGQTVGDGVSPQHIFKWNTKPTAGKTACFCWISHERNFTERL